MSLIDTTALSAALTMLLDWHVLLYIILGLAFGIMLGATPGISGTLGIGLMLPLTYHLETIHAIMFLSAIFTGSLYGGGVTAIMLNIPGTPAAVATTLDGYAMTKQGKQNEALGIGLGSSVLGCLMGYIVIFFLLLPLGQIVLSFGPPEMLMLTLFSLTVIGTIQGDLMRSLLVGFFGLLLGTIGATAFARPRGTFGLMELYEGIPLVPVLIGLLAVSELFFIIERSYIAHDMTTVQKDLRAILRGMAVPLKHKFNLLRSAVIGMVIGLLPAAGATIASLVSYGQAHAASKDPETFGKGNPAGIVAAETANNASESGGMATMMTFGIPGGSATAVLMAAFMLHGLSPGPYLVRDHMDLTYAVIIGNWLQGLLLLGMGLAFIWYFSKIIFVPTRLLVPVVALLAMLGSLAMRGLMIDATLTLLFGIIGFIMRKLDYPTIALLLGLILGKMVDGEFARVHIMFSGRYEQLVTRPIFLGLLVVTIAMFFIPFIRRLQDKKNNSLKASQ
ncbi:MAG: tripartite tricarboxylate transporter permease [Bacillota bacterium]